MNSDYSLVEVEANPRILDECTTENCLSQSFSRIVGKGLLSVESVNVLVGYLGLITTDSYQNMTGSQYDDNTQSWSSAEQSPVPRSSVAFTKYYVTLRTL